MTPPMGEQRRIAQAVETAQWLARQGFGIVRVYAPTADGCSCPVGAACHSPGKHPIGDDWQRRATRSPDTIAQVIGRDGQYGVLPWAGEGKLILDVDHHDRLPVRLPPSYRVRRGQERGHAYFSLPEGINPMTLPATAPWGEGAARHVVGPYSRHASGDIYLPVGDTINEIPADVLQQLLPPKDPALRLGNGHGYHMPEPGYRTSRYDEVARFCASRYKRGIAKAEAWAGMLASTVVHPADPLPESEWRSRFERAWPKPGGRLGQPMPEPVTVSTPALRFYTPAEVSASVPGETTWVIPRFAATGAITEIDGKIKAAGKTTLALHMVRAVIDGDLFLDEATKRERVIYVTEQSRQTFGDALRLTGLEGRGVTGAAASVSASATLSGELTAMKWENLPKTNTAAIAELARRLKDLTGDVRRLESDQGRGERRMDAISDELASARDALEAMDRAVATGGIPTAVFGLLLVLGGILVQIVAEITR